MTIYTNSSNRVVSVDTPVDNATAINIDDDEVFKNFSETRKLCYNYIKTEDGVTFYPAMNLDDIAVLEHKQEETNNLNSVVDALIIESLEGGDSNV